MSIFYVNAFILSVLEVLMSHKYVLFKKQSKATTKKQTRSNNCFRVVIILRTCFCLGSSVSDADLPSALFSVWFCLQVAFPCFILHNSFWGWANVDTLSCTEFFLVLDQQNK